jgi:hypothetical protein
MNSRQNGSEHRPTTRQDIAMPSLKLDLRGRNYFFDRAVLDGEGTDWQRWRDVFEAATRGDFSRTPELMEVYATTRSPLLQQACSRLLGDAGSSDAMATVHEYLDRHLSFQDPLDPYAGLHMLDALVQRGWLVDVEKLLKVYEFIISAPDARVVALYFSRLLEPEWGPLSEPPRTEEDFPPYKASVLARARELIDATGSDRIPVAFGEVLHVPEVARMLLRRLSRSDENEAMQPFLRRRLEACTGIDCSGFFEDGGFRPLTAATMLESMLESGVLARYVAGRRYFFGFPVP